MLTFQFLDALILPGGWCPDYLRRDKRFVDLVKNMVTTGILVIIPAFKTNKKN